MNTQQLAFKFTRKEEGGWVDNPNDPGKETIDGISREYHPNLRLWILIDEMKRATNSPEAFKKAIQTTAIEAEITSFYSKHWDKFKCSELKPVIDIILFDTSFMSGKAVKLLQESINSFSLDMIKEDNNIGKYTIEASNKLNVIKLGNEFMLNRLEYQINLKDSAYFYKDWVNRIVALYKYLKHNYQ